MPRAPGRPGAAAPATGPVWIATAGLGVLWIYVGVVLFLDEYVLGVTWVDWILLPVLLAGCVAIHLAVRTLHARGRLSRGALFAAGVLGLTLSASLLAVDVAFTIVLNRRADTDALQSTRRLRDPHLWQGEILPRIYQPGDTNYFLHKPGVVIEARAFGEFYDAKMLDSPTLRDEVLEPRDVRFRIDAQGFRETTPLADARVFALGDSFVFGFGIDQPLVWTEQLEALSGRPVYNLGVSATGPAHQLRVLEHLLATRPGTARVEELLWVVFEGNDLENSYAPESTLADGGGGLLRGTVLESLRAVPLALKEQSVLHRLRQGGLRAEGWPGAEADPTLVDGVRIPYPLYRSAALGPRMFNPEHLKEATLTLEDVRAHPNLPLLRAVFERMATLAETHGFRVTVVLAPTATRVHGRQYEGFPPISDRPWFLEETTRLAEQAGFAVVDLLPVLTAAGEDALVYFRDDHHWNERGNRVVAERLAGAVAAAPR
jgi:hypothetical protein